MKVREGQRWKRTPVRTQYVRLYRTFEEARDAMTTGARRRLETAQAQVAAQTKLLVEYAALTAAKVVDD